MPIFVVQYQSFGDGDGVQVTCRRHWTALVGERSGERSLVSDQVLDRTRAVIGRASFGEQPSSDFCSSCVAGPWSHLVQGTVG